MTPRHEKLRRQNEIAETILAQLGGNKFIAMTGSHSFTTNGNGLTFKLKMTKAADFCTITLNAMDTYDIKFGKVSMKKGLHSVQEFEGYYADMLVPCFEKVTGLYTSL